jgi:hypothetical protein
MVLQGHIEVDSNLELSVSSGVLRNPEPSEGHIVSGTNMKSRELDRTAAR